MLARTILMMLLCGPGVVIAEQPVATNGESAPDIELLEFLALFDQRDAAVVDEIIDEQQASASPRKTNGERYEQ